jgi:hypothetical protein
MGNANGSHDTRGFWIDQIIAAAIFGVGLEILRDGISVLGLVFTSGGLGWLIFLRLEHKPMTPQVRLPNLAAIVALLLATAVVGYDIYDRHSRPAVVASQNCLGCDAWDDAKPLERVYGSQRHFVDEVVPLDGRHFINPVFDHVTFVYQGTGPVQMDNPTFVKTHDSKFVGDMASKNKVVTQTLSIATMVAQANGCIAVSTNFGPNSTLPTVPTAP